MRGKAEIAIVDVDAGLPLGERRAYADAQARQIAEDFGPKWWQGDVRVRACDENNPPAKGEIQIRLLNQPTLDGALGYHDCLPDGTPIAYVFAGLAKIYGDQWTSVTSHEVLELLADPLLRRAVQMTDGFWDMEVCDRVERYSYTIDSVPLSNFNYPECFEPPADLSGVKFDHMGLSAKPNQVLDGGYAQRFDPAKGWVQVGTMSAYRAHLSAMGLGRGVRRRDVTPMASFWSRVFGR